jgi:Protein of unknown function (DUF4038)/Domain of unknown function (DUF5060)
MKNKVFLMLMLFVFSANAQQRFAFESLKTSIKTTVNQPVDVVFKLKKSISENPFDISFGMIANNKSGNSVNIQGFYDGNNEYVFRFSANQIGVWEYTTFSSISQLTGLRGTINVVENTKSEIHGGIKIDEKNPQKFIYEDGKPYFALAFELDWLFALDYKNKTEIPKTKKIIETVKVNGFNQIVMNLYAYDVKWKVETNVPVDFEYKKPDYSPFVGTNEKPDFSQLNTDFFKHFDRVIQHLHENGIVAHVMIYVWNKNVNWATMYSEGDNRYFDYVIKRYQAYPNIIWDISKEALDYGRCDIPYINERIARIRKNDAYERLITVHDYEYCSREPDKLDFISIQNWRSDLYSLSLESKIKHPNKPVMNIEHGGYESGPYLSFTGNYTNPENCLIRNYEVVFAGLYSSYYWQNTAWNIVVYDPMNPKYNFKKPRFDYYKHLQNLFTKYDYNTLEVYKPKLTTNGRDGLDNLSSSGYPLTNGKDLYLFLVPATNDQVNVILPKPPSGKLEVTWFNIFTGEYMRQADADWWNWRGFENPFKNQYSVLILRAL